MIKKSIRANYIAILSINFYIVVFLNFLPYAVDHAINFDKNKDILYLFMIFLTIPFLITWFSLYILIFSRGLRDEYHEKIWQRSMRSFGVVIFVVPWIWFIAWLIHGYIFPDQYWLLRNPDEFLFRFNGADKHNISQLQKSGVDFALMQLLTFSPMVFAALFKWHAWRDRD